MSTWVQTRFQTYARVVLLLGLWLVVAVRYVGTLDIWNLSKITMLLLGTLSGGLLGFMWAAQRRSWLPRLRLFFPAVGFLVALIVATVTSRNWRVSLIGNYGRYDGLLPHLLFALLAVVIVTLYWERPRDLKDFARVAVGWVVADGGVVLLQTFHLEGISWVASGAVSQHPVGTLGNSDFAGAALGIALPLCVYCLIRARHTETRAFLGGVVLLDVACLGLTATRGGLVAAAAGLVCMGVCYRDRFPSWAKVAAVSLLCLGVLTVVVDVAHPGMKHPPRALTRVSVLDSGTLRDRAQYWVASFRLFREAPIVGTGLSTFYEFYPQVRDASEGAQAGLTISDEPHNVFVQYLSESGLLGFAAYLCLILLALWYARRRLRMLQGPERDLLVAFMATLVAYLAQSFFSIDVPPLAMTFWVALAGVVCLADPAAIARREALVSMQASVSRRRGRNGSSRRVSEAEIPSVVSGPTRWCVFSALACGVALLVAVGVQPLKADYVAHMAYEPLPGGRVRTDAEAIRPLRQAAALDPLESAYWADAGAAAQQAASSASTSHQKIAWLKTALRYDRQGLALVPRAEPLMATMGQVYTALASQQPAAYPAADTWWRKAISDDPTDWKLHDSYAEFLAAWATSGAPGARAQQVEQLRLVVRMRPTDPEMWLELAGAYSAQHDTPGQIAALRAAMRVDPNNRDAETLLRSAVSGPQPASTASTNS